MIYSIQPTDQEKVRMIVAFLRDLASEIENRGVVSISAKNYVEQVEVDGSTPTKEWRVGPHMTFVIEIDWKDVPPEGEGESDVRRVM